MAVGTGDEQTWPRAQVLAARGYPAEIVAGHNGNGHHPEVETPAPAAVEELPAAAVEKPAPTCRREIIDNL